MDSRSGFDSMGAYLATAAGDSLHRFSVGDLAVVTSSPALLGSGDKRRYRLLEAVGDNALSMAVATKCLVDDLSAQTYQEARSVVTSNAVLGDVFSRLDIVKFVSFVTGVVPSGKAGASAMEVCVGLVYNELGMSGVVSLCEFVGLYDRYSGW